MTRRLTPLLVVVVLLLALLLAALWFAPGTPARWRAWHAPAPQPPNLDDVQTALLTANPAAAAEYPEVLDRPLLMPTRRPAAAASDPAAAAPPLVEQVKFTGIVAGPTLNGVLLDDQGQSRFVRQGEAVGDWMLHAIDGRTLIFKRGGQTKQIDLPYANLADDKKNAKTPASAPSAAAASRPAAAPASWPAPAPASQPAPAAGLRASAPAAAPRLVLPPASGPAHATTSMPEKSAQPAGGASARPAAAPASAPAKGGTS